MATKLTKSSLKGIIKECLIELLSEGLSSSPESLAESFTRGDIVKETISKDKHISAKKSLNREKPRNPNFRGNVFLILAEFFKMIAKLLKFFMKSLSWGQGELKLSRPKRQ